jgi:hypothetical protein
VAVEGAEVGALGGGVVAELSAGDAEVDERARVIGDGGEVGLKAGAGGGGVALAERVDREREGWRVGGVAGGFWWREGGVARRGLGEVAVQVKEAGARQKRSFDRTNSEVTSALTEAQAGEVLARPQVVGTDREGLLKSLFSGGDLAAGGVQRAEVESGVGLEVEVGEVQRGHPGDGGGDDGGGGERRGAPRAEVFGQLDGGECGEREERRDHRLAVAVHDVGGGEHRAGEQEEGREMRGAAAGGKRRRSGSGPGGCRGGGPRLRTMQGGGCRTRGRPAGRPPRCTWVTARVKRPVMVLGSLDGVETGVRNLIRRRPLEVERFDSAHGPIRVPTLAEMARIKAWLVLKRNATRDDLDLIALAERLGPQAAPTLTALDDWCADQIGPGEERIATQLARQLGDPNPYDLSEVDLTLDRRLKPALQRWPAVVAACQALAVGMVDALAGTVESQDSPREGGSR